MWQDGNYCALNTASRPTGIAGCHAERRWRRHTAEGNRGGGGGEAKFSLRRRWKFHWGDTGGASCQRGTVVPVHLNAAQWSSCWSSVAVVSFYSLPVWLEPQRTFFICFFSFFSKQWPVRPQRASQKSGAKETFCFIFSDALKDWIFVFFSLYLIVFHCFLLIYLLEVYIIVHHFCFRSYR